LAVLGLLLADIGAQPVVGDVEWAAGRILEDEEVGGNVEELCMAGWRRATDFVGPLST
jgi:hypothetical protein